MLRVTQAAGASGAKGYFTESLDRGDYYSEGQELPGQWGGKAAAELGLSGDVGRNGFFAMCDNLDPRTGGPLTLRTKANRRVGYDINFHCPKDVSVVHALTGDDEILAAFKAAVGDAMSAIEADMQCRVRKGGAQEDRLTGNLAWATFVHQTARPVGGVPDPHLHAHCFTFNATRDPEEDVWKAGQFGNIKKDAGYYEALFHNQLRHGLELAGYRTKAAGKFFELEDAPESLRSKFSRRTELIEAEAAKKGIIDPGRKGELGARTRDKKMKGASMSELRELEWIPRLSPEELRVVRGLKATPRDVSSQSREEASRAVEFAIQHAFERESVISEKLLLQTALRQAGPRARLEDIRTCLADNRLIRTELDGRKLVTTKEALSQERAMLDFARQGIGKYPGFYAQPERLPEELSVAQRRAAEGVLNSRDGVTVVRGGAGTGKTFMMRAVVAAIEQGGKTVLPVAPTTDAAHKVLRDDGFRNADTVQRLLVDEKLQRSLCKQVLWVDEAGLLGTRQMAQLFEVAKKQEARVILTGDDRQHGSVERGGPFKLLRQSGVASVQLNAIRRQQGDYKALVKKIERGRYSEALEGLEGLGWLKEVPQSKAHGDIAREVSDAARRGVKKPLVIAPTHKEKDKLVLEIRRELRDSGQIARHDRKLPQYKSLNLTEAERRNGENYEPGQMIQFNKRAVGFKAGQKTEVLRRDEQGCVWVRGPSGPVALRKDEADRFDVYSKGDIGIAAGDEVRITRNGKAKDGQRALKNGAVHKVRTFDSDTGDLVLQNGMVIPKEYGHIDHAYVETSYGTQGKTSDRVIVAQSAESFGASNAHQFYVSLSRGKVSACVYTDDKATLARRIERFETLRNATDAVAGSQQSPKARESQNRDVTNDERRRRTKEQERERTL